MAKDFRKILLFVVLLPQILLLPNASGAASWVETLAPHRNPQASSLRRAKEILFSLGADYRLTDQNFSASREKMSLPSGNSLESMHGLLAFSYGFSKQLTLFADMGFTSTSVTTPATSISQFTHGDFDTGLRFSPEDSAFLFEVGALLPTTSAPTTAEWNQLTKTSTAPISLGVFQYWFSANIQHEFNAEWAAEFGVGMIGRSKGYANLLVPQAHLKYQIAREFLVKVGAQYSYPIYEDAYSARTTAPERGTVLTGGSLLYNSINPVLLFADISAAYYLTPKLYAQALIQLPVQGKNTAVQNVYGFNIGLHFDPVPGYSAKNAATSQTFRTYSLSALIIKINHKTGQFLIDKGKEDSVKKGDVFDLFEPSNDGEETVEVAARARVIEAGPTRSKLQILETYSYGAIKEGFIVKRIAE